MTIKTIHVKNFKSFKELHVDLGKFNVLIGANASGKSNFIRVFEFREILRGTTWKMRSLCRVGRNTSRI